MGNQQMKKHTRSKDHDDIISRKSLEVVKDIILFLKQHSREEGLFRRPGHRLLRERILHSLKKGEKLQISNTSNSAKECAAALHLYLTQMKTPVMPKRIQELLLADNPGITAHVIARDALGLIRQDVIGRHSELLVDILELLRHLLIFPPPSERTELQAPSLVTTFMPVFFNLASSDVVKWRKVALRLNELIIEAPKQLFQRQKQCATSDIEIIANGSNTLSRFRDLSLFYPLIRFVEYRSTCNRVRQRSRNINRPLRRPVVGRLHPIILGAQT